MQFVAKVLSVDGPTRVSTAGGGYEFVEVAFKRVDDGKVDGKKLMSFTNKTVFDTAKTLKGGEDITVTIEKQLNKKDGKEYWQWIALVLGVDAVVASNSTQVARSATKVTGSNYETSDERKLRQQSIVRQSSLSNALKFVELSKMKDPDISNVLRNAEILEDWVNRTEPAQGAIDMVDDIPV